MKHDLNKLVPQAEAQNDAILAYMMDGNRLTSRQAQKLFNCDRLAARIKNLRDYGWHIRTRTIYANGKRFAEYELEDSARASA